ncbi:hypothetical protein [Microbacterium excoecariae]|uniref:hypothetical protein n=1 Tax=Microbacterium excoecariae TaxID=2715210 RepID=UPI0014083956|nr:hypothetical protein [Microbacterium excoecariae]NHI16861.1 hypothetical protein [Microbacterium excoecariae]
MAILPEDIGPDEQAARRVLARARDLAPCLDSLTGEPQKDALAILKGVYAELPDAGARRARSLSRNGTAITYDDAASAFSDDDVVSLRGLCARAGDGFTFLGMPRASFPIDGVSVGIWPGERYS